MGKEKKISKSSPKYDSARQTGVLLEEIRDDVKLLAEQHVSVIERLDKIENAFAKRESAFFKMEWGIESIKSKTGTLDTKVDRLEKVLDENTNKIDRIEQKLDTNLANHEVRIKKVEEKVGV